MDRRTLRIWDRSEGKMKWEDFYMDEFDTKEQFAEAVTEYALGMYEFVMGGKPNDEDDE